jgi:hypothetical protein
MAGSRGAAARPDRSRPRRHDRTSLAAVLVDRPAVVKLNADEAGLSSAMSVSDASSAAEAGRVLRDAGAVWVVVTLGSAGAVVVGPDEQTHLLPPELRGAYPVGSGDAFLGGLAVAHAQGEPVVNAARLGLAAGIANAQVPGAGELNPATIGGDPQTDHAVSMWRSGGIGRSARSTDSAVGACAGRPVEQPEHEAQGDSHEAEHRAPARR